MARARGDAETTKPAELLEPTGRSTMLGFLGGLLFIIQRLLLCLFYVAGIALLFMKSERCRRLFAPLATVGRMPLANYLAQSMIFTTLFYSNSHWWLERFRFGPLEWLWRGATYGRFPAIRLARVRTVATAN